MNFSIYFLGFQKQNKNYLNNVYTFFEFLSTILKSFAINYFTNRDMKRLYTK